MALPVKKLPVRGLDPKSSRLSQSEVKILAALRSKILSPHTDKLNFFSYEPFDFSINVDLTTNEAYPAYSPVYLEINVDPRAKPTVLHISIDEPVDSHALLLIYFPAENIVDIVSTYAIEQRDIIGIERAFEMLYQFYKHTKDPTYKRTAVIVNDVACLSVNPKKFRDSATCYNLQVDDTAEIGWCVAWMMKFTEVLSKNDEFWRSSWPERRPIYKDMYNSFVDDPNFNSMAYGKEIWNGLIEIYNRGGKRRTRKRKTLRRLKRMTLH